MMTCFVGGKMINQLFVFDRKLHPEFPIIKKQWLKVLTFAKVTQPMPGGATFIDQGAKIG